MSVGELTVWSGPDRDAPALATVPRRAILEGLGMVLDAFGISVPTDRPRAQAHRFQGTSGPDTGFLLEVLQSVAETYGLEGQDLIEERRYRRWTLDEVREHLRAGHLVIPQLRYRLCPVASGPA